MKKWGRGDIVTPPISVIVCHFNIHFALVALLFSEHLPIGWGVKNMGVIFQKYVQDLEVG